MKRKQILPLLAAFLLIFATGSSNAATLAMDGTIKQLTYDSDDITQDTITVDYWNFTVTEAGTVTIDVLSWERDPDEWFWVDVNNDGEDAFIDSSIHVFKDTLSADNIYASNDDSTGNFGNDGTIRGNDSYISMNFEPGNYIIAISSCGYSPYFSVDEAVAGVNEKAIVPYAKAAGEYGDYRITVTGNVSAVPVPGAFCLLGAGLLALAGFKRKK